MAPYTNNKQYQMKIELGIFNLNAHALGSYARTKQKIFFCKEYKRTTLYHLVQHSMSTEKTLFFAWLHIPATLEMLGFLLS